MKRSFKTVLLVFLIVFLGQQSMMAQETKEEKDKRMQWWREAKFGMFIHWGVYATFDGSEWHMHGTKVPVETYKSYAKDFNPVAYDPAEWVRMAKNAGMKYIVITAKHHDGFALYDSKVTDWDITGATPYKKDLLKPLVEEAHKAGLKIGFYYSHAQDWVHPGGAKMFYENGEGWDESHKGNFDQYLKDIALPQTEELLKNYPIDILWWDTPVWMNNERIKPFQELLKLRPNIITNNRLGPGSRGDSNTPEQYIPIFGYEGDWETCMTIGKMWAYSPKEKDYKSTKELIQKFVKTVSKGGNLLLNVGPMPNGLWAQEYIDRFSEIGKWMKVNSESIYGSSKSPFIDLSWGDATTKENKIYLHVFDWPKDGKLNVPLLSKVKKAYLLANPKTKLKMNASKERLIIHLPENAPDAYSSTIVLELAKEPMVRNTLIDIKKATATSFEENNPPENIIDKQGTKWIAKKGTKDAIVELNLGESVEISKIVFQEPNLHGSQEIKAEAFIGEKWSIISEFKTTGNGYDLIFDPIKTSKLRFTISTINNERKRDPGFREIAVFKPE